LSETRINARMSISLNVRSFLFLVPSQCSFSKQNQE